MAYGLQIRDAAGNLTFDTTAAMGAVCVGLVVVPTAGATYSFPAFPGRSGRWVFCGYGYGASSVTVDTSLGYPRFIFAANAFGSTGLFALFVY